MKKQKLLLIDRDGTLICEPADYQIDCIDKLKFYPDAISMLARIANELDYTLVMVSNQDGLGTAAYPRESFDQVQKIILDVMDSVGIVFREILIDPSLPEENSPNRKPGTGMVAPYLNGEWDLENSFVIGDRQTDVMLAANMGCKAIFLNNDPALNPEATFVGPDTIALETTDWKTIYEFLRFGQRRSQRSRVTKETDIRLTLNLDGNGKSDIATGIGFLDHLLELFTKHSGLDLSLRVKGDLQVDEHHTVEDAAIVLGEAFAEALGEKAGIDRYGFSLPMDESAATALLDFGGRNEVIWNVTFRREKIGDMPTELFRHFFKSFGEGARCNLHLSAQGENEHHVAEAIYKAFARSVRQAIRRDIAQTGNQIPSTKGVLA